MEKDEFGVHYTVVGAGKIRLSDDCNHHTGNVVGFGIGVSWTEYPYIGGVISIEEAQKLADHIYQQLRNYKLNQIIP